LRLLKADGADGARKNPGYGRQPVAAQTQLAPGGMGGMWPAPRVRALICGFQVGIGGFQLVAAATSERRPITPYM